MPLRLTIRAKMKRTELLQRRSLHRTFFTGFFVSAVTSPYVGVTRIDGTVTGFSCYRYQHIAGIRSYYGL